MVLRTPTHADVDALAETTHEGFAGYAAFAPPGYEPPSLVVQAGHVAERLVDPESFALSAWTDDGAPAGHVLAGPPRDAAPGLRHLFQLFLRAEHHGTGLASALLRAAVQDARGRPGIGVLRLATPAGQARARAFYAREGFVLHGDPAPEPRLAGLLVVELRLDLGSGA